ncbi:MAG: PAN domain-containing protein [Nitrospirales bacterium]
MMKYCLPGFTLMILFFLPASSFAVERGCKAMIYIKKESLELKLDDFSGRSLGNNGNDARKNARKKIWDCAFTARDIRWEHRKPDQCKPNADVFDYDIDSLKIMVERVACAVGRDKGTLEIRIGSSGDKNCDGDGLIMNYDMIPQMCEIMRSWEWDQDRSGSNFKDLDLVKADPGLCQKQCEAHRNCEGWTYVKPGVQATNARCWLKSTVNKIAIPNSCCVSGVKGFEHGIDRPGSDYRNFLDPNPLTCREYCEKDSRCKAWTWVQTGITNQGSRCWLKSTVPQARPHPNTISGVK